LRGGKRTTDLKRENQEGCADGIAENAKLVRFLTRKKRISGKRKIMNWGSSFKAQKVQKPYQLPRAFTGERENVNRNRRFEHVLTPAKTIRRGEK